MSFCFRKKARVLKVQHTLGPELKIYLNNKSKTYYEKACCISPSYYEILANLKGEYNVQIAGGGLSSQVELLEKVLYQYLDNLEIKKAIKLKYPLIDRTDERQLYPKKYGGRKARARSQKSYR